MAVATVFTACGQSTSSLSPTAAPQLEAAPTSTATLTPPLVETSTATPSPTQALTNTPAATIIEPTETARPSPAPSGKPTSTALTQPNSSAIALPHLRIEDAPGDIPEYNRDEWKHWIDSDSDCQNSRAEVLIEESLGSVGFRDDRECAVDTGQWLDRFTGETILVARDLDIDHFVPLKNAHDSGGWSWTSEQKEAFANDLTFDGHLIAVTASANRSKGAKGPEEWQPTNNDYLCEYAVNWITVKANWGLSANPDEWAALEEMLTNCAAEVSIEVAIPAPQVTATVVIPTLVPSSSTVVPVIIATPIQVSNCDPAYPDVCIAPPPPDLNCGDIEHRRFMVLTPDPHRFDRDKDGIGCES